LQNNGSGCIAFPAASQVGPQNAETTAFPMNIKLVSEDGELYKLCREILAESAGEQPWTITAVPANDAWKDADLHIWDFQPNVVIPDYVGRRPSKHLFLVDRKDLASFRENTGAGESNILLKPVTRATLSAFLDLAFSGRTASSLRADRDEILQCLIQANLKLQEYDQDRTNFLARAVHDFRAPLTAVSGYCGLLLSEPLGPLTESQREVLRRMKNSAARLSRMASAMFHLSVGRHVKRRPELQKGDIRDCLDQALHEIAPFADEKGIAITPTLEPLDYDLYFEAGQIEQVLINILDNACKFTPKAGSIEIRGYPFFWERRTLVSSVPLNAERRRRPAHDANSYRIDITDSGNAIPEEHLLRIFEEYTSYAGGRDRSGGGLGLAICRMILAQHEGRVWAENTHVGPRFSFVLPLHRSDRSRGDNDYLPIKTEAREFYAN
jgi:signal transduction histidine kinase